MADKPKLSVEITSLEQMVAVTCFCKLRERCEDKNGDACMRKRNIVAEVMTAKYSKPIK